jgi:glycosyltransferase involved in cell wall biosynthesis
MIQPILFIDHAAAIGGAENSLLMLMRHLEKWQPHLATVDGKLAEAAREANIPVHIAPMQRLRKSLKSPNDLWHGAQAIAQIATRIEAAALYTNTIRAQIYGVAAARLAQKPLIWHMRDFWLTENRPKNSPLLDTTLKRLFIANARAVITNSHATAARLPKSPKINVVHNGIELGRFDPTLDGTLFRKQFDIPLDAPLVGMMGRLRPWKGQMRFLDVAAQVAAQRDDVYFTIIGGATFGVQDDYEQRLRQKTASLGLNSHVKFTGHLDNTPAALAALDIFVHPGDPEPFGLVNIEAMAMRKPVVAFKLGALPEIIEDGKTGYLVDTTPQLAISILNLIKDPTRRQQFGIAGKQRVIEQFTIQHTATKIEGVLHQCLN